jgi:hypothetical protein
MKNYLISTALFEHENLKSTLKFNEFIKFYVLKVQVDSFLIPFLHKKSFQN